MKEKAKLPESFCVAPFVEVDLNEQGHVNPCCKSREVLGYWSKEKISTIWNNDRAVNLRRDFLEGKKPSTCRRCWEDEGKGVESRRQEYNRGYIKEYKKLEELYQDKDIEDIVVRPLKFGSIDIGFGAKCGLRCRMCNPKVSSKWLSTALADKEVFDFFKAYGDIDESNKSEIRFKDFLDEELFVDFCKNIVPNVADLAISGGEPLASDQLYRLFAEMLTPEQLKTMKITITTNGQTTDYRGKSLLPYWAQLRRFLYRVSVDGVGERYEYVRPPAQFEKVRQSLREVRKIFPLESGILTQTCTVAVSIYNITSIPDIVKFCIEEGTLFHKNWVRGPSTLDVAYLPEPLAKKTAAELRSFLENIESIKEWDTHPLWKVPLKYDSAFEEITYDYPELNPEELTYKDLGLDRIRSHMKQLILQLDNCHNDGGLSEETKAEIRLMDRINSTNFLKLYPEYQPYW